MPNSDTDRSTARKQERASRVAVAIYSVGLSGGQGSGATGATSRICEECWSVTPVP